MYLFAYGTLKPGLAPTEIRPVVDRLLPYGPATAVGSVYDLGSYPGARFGEPGTIHGAVYVLPAGDELAVLAALDAYEDVPNLYVRQAVPVTLADGRTLTCWAYQYNRDLSGRTPIPSGDYVREDRP